MGNVIGGGEDVFGRRRFWLLNTGIVFLIPALIGGLYLATRDSDRPVSATPRAIAMVGLWCLWGAYVCTVVVWPPRAQPRRVGHHRIVLSVNLVRRVLISLGTAPLWVFALSGLFEGDPWALPFSFTVGVMNLVLWLLLRYRIEVTDEGLSRVTVFGKWNIPWSRVRSIGVAPGGVTVLDEAGKYILISSWFLDGYPVLAEVLIARVTASVLEKSGGRSLLEKQAAAARR